MHPEFMQQIVAERINDLRREADAAHRATRIRRDRRAGLAARPVSRLATPLSTRPVTGHESVPAEPVGAGHGHRAA